MQPQKVPGWKCQAAIQLCIRAEGPRVVSCAYYISRYWPAHFKCRARFIHVTLADLIHVYFQVLIRHFFVITDL